MSIPIKINPVVMNLVRAKQVLITEGWIQNRWHSKAGYCVLGAMNRASLNNTLEQTIEIFAKANNLRNDMQIWLWNDNEYRTIAQVLEALDRAIAYAGSNVNV